MTLDVGTRLGRYEIISQLGLGGMGEVYLAWDTQLDRQVAWSPDSKKLAGVKHLPNGVHSGIGVYDLDLGGYDWLTDFGDWLESRMKKTPRRRTC